MITVYITDVNDSKLTIQTLNSLKKLKYLKEIILVITKEDCLDFENIKKINENFSIKNVEVQIIQNDSKNENKFSHISKCKNKYIYQLQAGNVLSPKTNKFLNKLLKENLLTLEEGADLKDPKSKLQEHLQKRNLQLPSYSLKQKGSKEKKIDFKVFCEIKDLNISATGKGQSRKKAELSAAQKLLNQVEIS